MQSVAQPVEQLLPEMVTNSGQNLHDLSQEKPILLIFLRHFGCIFCREALADIATRRTELESGGAQVVFVHMSENEVADRYFSRYELEGIPHISDQECKFYAGFGLTKGTFTQLFGLKVWMRGFTAGVLDGHGVGNQLGDGFQMPGVFVIKEGQVRESFIHKLASDRPDYHELVKCCVS